MSMFRTFEARAPQPAWRRLSWLLAPLMLAGCAMLPGELPSQAPPLFDDARFGAATEPIDPRDVFRMSTEMRAYLDKMVGPAVKVSGMRRAITDALYDQNKLQLEYESSRTRTAAEAFQARQGNCLSLVIMTGAFAKALGLKVTYQQVMVDETWSRTGGMYFSSGHVNLVLEHHYMGTAGAVDRNDSYTIDFMPGDHPGSARTITQDTVLAMFMNNRAAEAMIAGKLDDAYWRVRQAVALDPNFLSSYNTLGVIYLRHGDAARAEQVMQYALKAAPDNPHLLSNYAQALRELGRTGEADAVVAHLAAVEPTPPFYWYVQGQTALHKGDFQKARALFLKEIDRAPDNHEFHYALAVADFELNRLDEASREMALALENAVKRTDHDLYAGKLDKLNAWRAAKARSPSLMQ